MKKNWSLILVFALLSSLSFASQEGTLKLSSFFLQSKGIGESGPVKVKGAVNENNRIVELSINAFGKDNEIPEEELEKIPAAFYNGVQLSYEEGYKSLGGKTIYIILQSGFISGIDNRVLISFTETGDVKIRELKK